MVAGLAFLSKKSFNPANISNQKQVWEAQQQTKLEEKRTKERQDQLRRERDDEELARARGGESQGDKATLNFMYKPPPGLEGPSKEASTTEEMSSEQKSMATERQPGDDDAAAAFRQMLAAAATTQSSEQNAAGDDAQDFKPSESSLDMTSSGAALSGTSIEKTATAPNKDALTALEKAVGRKDTSSSLTLQEQIARFPQLKNAPMAKGMSATNVGVTFKPLGTQLRNVRCMACGVWGHSRGDRECEASGWNPFAMTQPNNNNSIMSQQARRQQETSVDEQKRRSRDSDDYSSDDTEDSYQRRKRRRKHRKSRKESKRRRRRSSSPNDDRKRSRKSSHKKRKKHSRHD